jgi:hypothetical protein
MHRRRGLYAGRYSPCSRSRVAEVLLSNIIMAAKAGDVCGASKASAPALVFMITVDVRAIVVVLGTL